MEHSPIIFLLFSCESKSEVDREVFKLHKNIDKQLDPNSLMRISVFFIERIAFYLVFYQENLDVGNHESFI